MLPTVPPDYGILPMDRLTSKTAPLLIHQIKSLERQRRTWMFAYRIMQLIGVIFIVFIILCALDRWLAMPRAARSIADGILVLGSLIFLSMALHSCLMRIDIISAACAIERSRPEFDERLVTLVSDLAHIHPTIQNRLGDEVNQLLTRKPAALIWPTRRTLIAIALIAALSTTIGFSISMLGWNRSAIRLLQPWTSVNPSTARRLGLIVDRSTIQRRHATVSVEAIIHGHDADDDEPVILHVQDRTGQNQIAMTPLGQNRFNWKLNGLRQSVVVYATLGSIRSNTVHVKFMPAKKPRYKDGLRL